VSPEYGIMALASLLRRGDQHQVSGTLLSIQKLKMDLFLGQV